jgi:predicted flap endonuclease-1-like 5' DNA nuclease
MELDSGESTVAISLADLIAAVEDEPDFTNLELDVAPAPDGAHDDLQRIRGVGPATAKRLNSAGIRTWAQMSQLSDNDLDQVADLLKISLDKIKREQWVEQARALIGG